MHEIQNHDWKISNQECVPTWPSVLWLFFFLSGEAVGFVVFAMFFLFLASFCNTFQVFIGRSQLALCKDHGKKLRVTWSVVFEIRKTSPGKPAAFPHVKSGLDAKQLSIIWQSLQVETVTEGAAEFQLVANLSPWSPWRWVGFNTPKRHLGSQEIDTEIVPS